jgi:hypothetical protein
MTIQQMMLGGGGSKAGFFATVYPGSGIFVYGTDADSDSSGNVYLVANDTASTSGVPLYVAKFNATGTLQWQRQLSSGSTTQTRTTGIVSDTSGNTYSLGQFGTTPEGVLVKYSNAGSITFQRSLTRTNGFGAGGVALDSTGANVAISGSYGLVGSITAAGILKYNSSGTLAWQRSFSSGFANNPFTAGYCAFDSSGNVYLATAYNVSGSTYDGYLVKYNSSGTLQWQRKFVYSGAGMNIVQIVVDASANIFISTNYGILKYDTSGAYQWGRIIAGVTSPKGLGVDSTGNIYVCGSLSPSTDLALYSIDTSGNLLWYNYLRNSSGSSVSAQLLTVNQTLNIITVGYGLFSGSTGYAITANVPTDGSLAKGTATTVGPLSITYTASSATLSSATFTDSAGALTDAAGVLTDAAGTFTDAAGGLTGAVGTI